MKAPGLPGSFFS